MRVLVLVSWFKPDFCAIGNLITELSEEIAKLGHEVTVITSVPHFDANKIWPEYRWKLFTREKQGLGSGVSGHGSDTDATDTLDPRPLTPDPSITIYRTYLYVPSSKGNFIGRIFNFASFNITSGLIGTFIKRHDVLLTVSPSLTNGLSANYLSKLKRMPFVFNVQDIYPDLAINLGVLKNPRLIKMFQKMEKFVYRKAAAVSVISEGFRQNLLAKGVPAEKLHIVQNFVDADFVKPLPRETNLRKELGLEGKFVVLYAGNIGLSQGLENVLDAAHALEETHHDIHFLMVGNGGTRDAVVARSEEMGLKNVTFLPFQPAERIPEVYATGDAGLVPLLTGVATNSVPSKVFTILGAGRPVVASVDPNSDTWALVEDVGCGVCVPPESASEIRTAVLAVYDQPDRGVEMGRKGREFVETRYTSKTAARDYEAIFKGVIGGSRLKQPAQETSA